MLAEDRSGAPWQKPKKRRHLNADQRHALKVADLGVFVKNYGRQAQRGAEPNDRSYDRKLERRVKRMKPTQLDALLRVADDVF